MRFRFHYLLLCLVAIIVFYCTCIVSRSQDLSIKKRSSSKLDFDGQSSYNFLADICNIGPRCVQCEGHNTVISYLNSTLKELNISTKYQQFSYYHKWDKKSYTMTNIIGSLNVPSKKKIILSTHFDTRPFADEDPNKSNYNYPVNGANDGGSGAAVLLELARVLSLKKPNINIEFLFLDGHEAVPSSSNHYFLGSKYYVISDSLENIFVVININMIGHSNLKISIDDNSFNSAPMIVNNIWSIAKASGYNEFSYSIDNMINDDHSAFIRYGVKAIDIIDMNYEYRHTVKDTIDKCHPRSLEVVGKTVLRYIYSL